MSELIISTAGLIQEVRANVDGHIFTIRKLGAGDELDIQSRAAKMAATAREVMNFKGKYEKMIADGKDENSEEAMDLLASLNDTMEKMDTAQKEIAECYLRLFNDGTKDNSRSRALLEKYGIEGLREINRRAFAGGSDE